MSRFTTIGTLALLALPVSLAGQEPSTVAQGAQVWANNCTRCHSARPSSERTDAQWTVIVNHMRARANLTKTQAWLATSFLQATNAPPDPPVLAVGSDGAQDDGTPQPETPPEKDAKEESAKAGGGQVDDGGVTAADVLLRIQEYLRELRRESGTSSN